MTKIPSDFLTNEAYDVPANCRCKCNQTIRQCLARQLAFKRVNSTGKVQPKFIQCVGCEHFVRQEYQRKIPPLNLPWKQARHEFDPLIFIREEPYYVPRFGQ